MDDDDDDVFFFFFFDDGDDDNSGIDDDGNDDEQLRGAQQRVRSTTEATLSHSAVHEKCLRIFFFSSSINTNSLFGQKTEKKEK